MIEMKNRVVCPETRGNTVGKKRMAKSQKRFPRKENEKPFSNVGRKSPKVYFAPLLVVCDIRVSFEPGDMRLRVLWILSSLAELVALLPNASPHDIRGRIAYGEKYDHDRYQYVVALKIVEIHWGGALSVRTCTGSLISQLIVLSAAHCVTHLKAQHQIRVYPGDISGRYILARKYRVHESYESKYFSNDLCLLKLIRPFPFIKRFAIIGGHPDDFAGDRALRCLAIGFGQMETLEMADSDGLATNITVKYGKHACLNRSDHSETGWKEFLCAVPDVHQTCGGDSGGPVICDELLYAITSSAYNYTGRLSTTEICGRLDMQDQYTFLHHFKDWISSTELALINSARLATTPCSSVLVAAAFFFFSFNKQ